MGSIKAKMFLGGLLSALISLILAAANVYSVNQGTEALSRVYERQVEPSSALQEMDRDLKEVRFRMAGVLLDQMPAAGSKNQLLEARDNVPKQWALFKEKTRDNAFSKEAAEQIAKIDSQLGALPQFLNKLEAAYSSDDKKIITTLLEDEWPPIQSGLLKPVTQLIATQQAAVKTAYEGSLANGKKLIFIGLGIFGVTVLLMMIAISIISSDIHRGIQALKDTLVKVAQGDLTATVSFKRSDELGEMGQSLENATSQLKRLIEGVKNAADKASNSASDLSGQIGQVIARGAGRNERVKRVAAAMGEIRVANLDVASSAGDAGEAVHRNEEFARQGDTNMGKNRAAMEKVIATANNSVSIVSNLNDSIQKIGQITTVIKEIADQTNLLALNAAIEAARAGEQGRGFAVVADEVRKLAERTSASTSEISGVVTAIRNETEAAVTSMSEVKREVQESANFNDLTGNALKQIVAAANQVTGMVGHIVDSAREQTAATENAARDMDEIAALTEENSANIRQVGQSAEDVFHIAGELQHLVGQFRVS